ncbi:MAG TPA: biopolymer transporter ExbD [Saprospiraceae bacterium]|nr:biopolymer transporter ExbD [Saprospiraceae bacterium]
MAEISNQTATAHSPDHKPRVRRMSTRIDFTPMVDLGFLLITFFMLTTSLAKPHIMALVMPDDSGKQTQDVSASKTLTLILGPNDRIYWYEGLENAVLDSTEFSDRGLRRVVLDKMGKVQAKWGLERYADPKTGVPKEGSALYVLIKPTPGSRYRNLVDVLDEMAICGVRYYTILDVSDAELNFVKNPAEGLKFSKL